MKFRALLGGLALALLSPFALAQHLAVLPHQLVVDSDGEVRSGAKLYVYDANTLTPRTTYTTSALSVENDNPVESLSNGLFPPVWVDPDGGEYKLVLKDENDVTIWTEDDIPPGIESQGQIAALLYPRTATEISAGVTPTDYSYPNGSTGVFYPARYGALGNDSANDYPAINNAFLVAVAAGGGEVSIECGKTYRIGTSLVIPEKVRLSSRCSHAQPSEIAGVIKPTSAVSVGIDDAGANRRGIAIDNITVDMQLMNNGSTGVRFSGVHQYEINKLGVYALPDATSIGLHLRGDAASGFGTLYGRITDLNISTNNLDRGIGVKVEAVGADKVNAVTFINARVAHMTTGWILDGTGSGFVCINCNSESNAADGVDVYNTAAGTAALWIGGEVNSNAAYGFAGDAGADGRIVVMNATMGSNSSGDFNTAQLSVPAELSATSTGPAIQWTGVHIKTDKSYIGGTTSQTVVASDTITSGTLKNRLTAASAITMSSNPQIADGTGNQLLTLIGTSNTNTIALADGNGLLLKSPITLRSGDSITLLYDSGGSNDWVEIGRQKGDNVVTFTNADATPSVANGDVFKTNGTTTITFFDDGYLGQCIRVQADANIQLTDSATLVLNGNANYSMTADDTWSGCMFVAGTWYEVARSVN